MLSSSRTSPRVPRIATRPAPRTAASALALCLGALYAGAASAALSDTIHPFASVVYSHDDNLLRLADTAANDGPRGDTMRQSQVGVLLERPIGRQLLTASAKVSRVSFSHYDQLNYNGKDLVGALQWHLFEKLDGHLGASYAQTLTPFTDYHVSERNLRVQRREYVDATWRVLPSWQLRSGFTRDKYAYDVAAQRYNDRVEDWREFGVDYLASSGSRVGLVARHLSGRYPNQRSLAGVTLDGGYSQDELKANIYWGLGGTTQVQVLAGWARREHKFYSQRDSNGLNGRVTAYWRPLGRVRFTLAGWREFAAVESTIVNSSLNKGASLAATWDASAKIKVDASLRSERRNFGTLNGIVLPGDPTDSLRNATVGLTYTPLSVLQLGVSAFHESRSGSPFIGSGSYRANGVSLNATAQF
jgi:exopolysaccharide biosynthesis operon protein EpsL